jgi:hypothetical protein
MDEINLEKSLENFNQETAKHGNILQALDVAVPAISLWNIQIGALLQTVLSAVKLGVNIFSQRKAEIRLFTVINTINRILKKQQDGETNYEAALVCPELFRDALIMEDEERVKEHLSLIETLFSSGKMNFDDLAEALRLVSKLSSMEYKILKLIPQNNTKWKDILSREEFIDLYKTQEERLTAAFLSLINMNLVVKKLVIKYNGGPELGTINYNDDNEYIRLSAYGQLFLKSLEEIKKEKQEN